MSDIDQTRLIRIACAAGRIGRPAEPEELCRGDSAYGDAAPVRRAISPRPEDATILRVTSLMQP